MKEEANAGWIEPPVLPREYRAAGVAAGVKRSGQKDLALIVSDRPAALAGTFTTNQVQAAPVKLCRERLRQRRARAIVANSGNANACTGEQGRKDAERMAKRVGELLHVPWDEVCVCSTGRIGVRLPMDRIEPGIEQAVRALSPAGLHDAAVAIMTTDTRPKLAALRFAVEGHTATLTAVAKGAGMIEPRMATMLCFLLTDAAVEPEALQGCLSQAVELSFNRITVDGDRSTNDTVLFLANGAVGNSPLRPAHPDWPAFEQAVRRLTHRMAMEIVKDGEGVTRVVTVRVRGARTDAEADAAARSIANSMLVKTSWAGDYPNWGRIMDALGYSPARVEEERVDIFYDEVPAALNGVASGVPLEELQRIVTRPAFTVTVDLHLGAGEAIIYGCNCTEEYVRINR